MADYTVWVLGESNLSITGGVSLDGITQGDGSHLDEEFITLNAYNFDEVTIRDRGSDDDFDDNDGNQRLDGAQTIDGVTYADGTRIEAEYFIELQAPDGTIYQVVAVNVVNSSPGFGTIEGIAFVDALPPLGVALEVVSSAEGPGSSGQPAIQETELFVPCFTPGTRITTPTGPKPVEDLALGDKVLTLDNGFRPIAWINRVTLGAPHLRADPSLCPVRVRAGAFGPNQPERDMLLSPQHRLLVRGWQAELHFGTHEGLAAVAHLVNDRTVLREAGCDAVTYIHFMFDRHEVVCADGIWAESFLPGPRTVNGLQDGPRAELMKLFPELGQGEVPEMTPARPIFKRWEAAMI